MDLDTLKHLIQNGEKLRVELKETPILDPSESNRFKIASQLVAFANRNGGKLIFGIKNDGAFEGAEIDADAEVQKILNIAQNKCSPPVVFNHQYLSTNNGDVLVIEVERRRGMPHAIVKRDNHEVKGRTYYIRTSKGIRLVDDKTLELLFSDKDPKLSSKFQIFVTYDRKSLGIPVLGGGGPSGFSQFIMFFNALSDKDKSFLKENESEIGSFVVSIAPYIMLKYLAMHFSYSWQIEIFKTKAVKRWQPVKGELTGDIFRLSDVTLPSDGIMTKLSFNLKELLLKPFENIVVPQGSEIKVDSDGVGKSSLKISKRDAFSIEFSFLMAHWNVGLPISSPLRYKYQGIGAPPETTQRMEGSIATQCLIVDFNADYSLDTENPCLKEHFQYGKTIQDLIEDDWNWDKFLEELPHGKLYSIEGKIDEILRVLGKPSKFVL